MASPASIPFDCNHPNFSYDLYVQNEEVRYQAALQARTAFLANRDCRPSIHVPRLVECIASTYSNKAERMAEVHRLAMTPWPVFNPPIQLVPPTKSTRVQHEEDDEPLKAKYPSEEAEDQNNSVTVSPDEDREREEAVAGDSAPIIGVRNTVSVNKKTIMAAFDAYKEGVPDGLTYVLGLSMKYAQRAIAAKRDNGAEGMDTPADYASAVGIKLWKELPAFKGDAFAFFKLLNKIQSNAGKDYVRKNKRETGNNVPLMIEFEDGDIEQNPLIHREQKQEYIKALPDWIQGVDRWICDLIREDKTYAQIATFLHITEPAVKERVAKMKKRNLAETKASGVVKRIRVRGEWVDSISNT